MSLSITMAIWAAQDLPQEFTALVQRLMLRSSDMQVRVHKKWYLEAEDLPDNLSMEQMESLTRTVVDSDNAIELTVGYQLYSGRWIPLTIRFYGVGFERGHMARFNGNINISLSHKDLARPLIETFQERAVTGRFRSQIAETTMNDVDELFCRVCGVDEHGKNVTAIEHGAMYQEYGWFSPVSCSMLYHRDVRQFAKDFVRIFAEYNKGIPAPATFDPSTDIWMLETDQDMRLGRERPEYYKQMEKMNSERFIQFLDSLNEQNVRTLSTMPGEEMRRYLNMASLEIAELASYDFGAHGLMLATDPLSSIWQAFAYVAEMQS